MSLANVRWRLLHFSHHERRLIIMMSHATLASAAMSAANVPDLMYDIIAFIQRPAVFIGPRPPQLILSRKRAGRPINAHAAD